MLSRLEGLPVRVASAFCRAAGLRPTAMVADQIIALTLRRDMHVKIKEGHEKPIRLHETPRLRTVRSWSDFVPYVASIKFRYDPAMDGTTVCKELWRQASGRAIRKKFPKYTVELKETEDFGPCEITVTYTNGKAQTIPAQHATLLDIYDVMAEVTEEILEKEELDELEKG